MSLSLLEELDKELGGDPIKSGDQHKVSLKHFLSPHLMESLARQNQNRSTSKPLHEDSLAHEFDIIDDLKQKLAEMEERLLLSHKETQEAKSTLDRERILWENKSAYYEKSLEDVTRRELDRSMTGHTAEAVFKQKTIELQRRFDSATGEYKQTINELRETNSELEGELSGKVTLLTKLRAENDKMKWLAAKKEGELLKKIEELTLQLENKENSPKLREKNEMIAMESHQKEIYHLRSELRAKEETIKAVKADNEMNKALLTQKCQFYEEKVTMLRGQVAESKKAHDTLIRAFELPSAESETNKRISEYLEIKDAHRMELKQIHETYDQLSKKLKAEIEILTERNLALESKIGFDANDRSPEETESIIEELKTLKREKLSLTRELEGLKEDFEREKKAYEEKVKQLKQEYEEEIESRKTEHRLDLEKTRKESEESLFQLKKFYEEEKGLLEKKLKSEISRANSRKGESLDDAENKFREEKQLLEEELIQIQEDLKEREEAFQALVIQSQNESDLLQKEIETLKKVLAETKNELELAQSMKTTNFEEKMNDFGEERTFMMGRIENLMGENSRKDLEILSLRERVENLTKNIGTKDSLIEQLQQEFEENIQKYDEKLVEARKRYQKATDELVERKIEFCREMALSHQKNEFMQKKINDLSRLKEESATKFEENLMKATDDYRESMEAKIQALRQEKQELERKMEKLKKDSKANLSSMGSQVEAAEQQKNLLEERLVSMEQKHEDLKRKSGVEVEAIRGKMENSQKLLVKERKEKEEKIKELQQVIEDQKEKEGGKSTEIERDNALLKRKVAFLEEQYTALKGEYQDTQKKFEATITTLENLKRQERSKAESSAEAICETIKQENLLKMQEAKRKHKMEVELLENSLKKSEETSKKLQQEVQRLLKERKLGESWDDFNASTPRSDSLSSDRSPLFESKEKEIKRVYEEKIKLIEGNNEKQLKALKKSQEALEQKLKDSEMKKTGLLFEFERDRAKWNMEKEAMEAEINELRETALRAERKHSNVVKENEKLRSDSRSSRRSIQLGGGLLGKTGTTSIRKSTSQAESMRLVAKTFGKTSGNFSNDGPLGVSMGPLIGKGESGCNSTLEDFGNSITGENPLSPREKDNK